MRDLRQPGRPRAPYRICLEAVAHTEPPTLMPLWIQMRGARGFGPVGTPLLRRCLVAVRQVSMGFRGPSQLAARRELAPAISRGAGLHRRPSALAEIITDEVGVDPARDCGSVLSPLRVVLNAHKPVPVLIHGREAGHRLV